MKLTLGLATSLFILIFTFSSNGQLLDAIQSKRFYEVKKEKLNNSIKKRAFFNNKRIKENIYRAAGAQVTGVVVDTSEFFKYLQVEIIDKYGHVHGYDNCSVTKSNFLFSGLYPGTYTIKFNNYYYDFPEYLGGDTSIVNATWFSLAEGESKHLDSIILNQIDLNTETPKDTFVVSGFVYMDSSNTKPFDGNMMLTLMSAPSQNGSASATNSQSPFVRPDSTGFFSLKIPLLPGEYYGLLRNIDKDTTFYSPFWLTGEKLYEEPTKITVPGSLNNLSLHLTLGARLTGTVFDESGDTITGSVDLALVDTNGYTISTTYCSADFPKYSFTAISPGEYYLKTDYPYDYVEHWYYPGTTDIKNAEKIKILLGQVSNYNFTLKSGISETKGDSGIVEGTVLNHNGDTIKEVRFETYYDDGNTEWNWKNGTAYSLPVKSGTNFKFCVNIDTWNSPDIYSVSTWYANSASKKNASNLILLKDEIKNVNFTLLSGGSIGGFIKNSNGESISLVQEFEDTVNNSWEYESEYVFIVKNVEDTSIVYYRDFDMTDVMGGFRLSGIYPGKYVITGFPYSEYYESVDFKSTKTFQPIGYNIISDTITVTEFNTEEIVLNVNNPVSGMIKGSYIFDNKTEYDDDYLIYVFNTKGELVTLTWSEWEYNYNKSLKVPNNIFKIFFPVDDNAWIQLHDTLGLGGMIESPIMSSQLAAGDYHLALVYWKETGNDENAYVHWFGQDSATILKSGNFDELDISDIISIPNNAETITLETDSSIVDGITFGTTPISTKMLGFNKAFVSKPHVSGGIIKFHYNFKDSHRGQKKVKLYSIQGREIYSKPIKGNKGISYINLNKSNLVPGMYVLKLDIGNKSLKYPIVYTK